VPLLALAAAAVAGVGLGAAAAAAALASVVWWFDSLSHAAWYSGRVAWALAAALTPLVVAGARVRPERLRPWALATGVVLLTAIAPMLGAVLSVAVAGAVLGFSDTRRRGVVPVVAMGLAASAVAVVTGPTEPTGVVVASRLSLLGPDIVDALSDGYGLDGNVRTAFRWLLVAAGAFGIHHWGRADLAARVLGIFLPLSGALAYLGGYLPVRWPVDPYWLWAPAVLSLVVPAGSLLVSAAKEVSRAAPRERVVVALAALVAVPQLGRGVLTYLPELMPPRFIRSPADLRVSALTGANERTPQRLAHGTPPPLFERVAQRLGQLPLSGRVVVLDRALAVYLRERTGASILGPLSLRGEATASADPGLDDAWTGDRLGPTLEQYAAEWLVAVGAVHPIERRGDELVPVEVLDTARFYRVREPTSYVAAGHGHIVSQERGRIAVDGASGDRVVLRLNYSDRLVCRPGCRVEPERVGDATFIAVLAPPPVFELVIMAGGRGSP
jgi:hypothetical protein